MDRVDSRRELPDIRDDHNKVLDDCNGFEWIGDWRTPSNLYKGAHERVGFKLYQEGKKGRKEEYRVGTFVSVNVHSKEGRGKGEAYAPSIAVIIGILEDKWGSCHVALHYFWRWGQIHAGADMHPATALQYRAQIFLQKECTEKDGNAVRHPGGCFKELVPAVHINHTVVVLRQEEVLSHYNRSGTPPLDAFEASYDRLIDAESGCRDNGFWYSMTFDHSSYTFESVCGGEVPRLATPADSDASEQGGAADAGRTASAAVADPVAQTTTATASHSRRANAAVRRLQIAKGLTMGDAFCGLGTVSIAASTIGFQVEFGIDSSRAAISSFRSNTLWATGHFNAITERAPRAEARKLEDIVSQLKRERAAGKQLSLPRVDYLHLSPPCQNVSSKKKLEKRTFSGAEVKSAMELVEILRPPFVTLEEVPGFLMQRFLPQNLHGELAGYPNPPHQAAEQSSMEAAPEDEQQLAEDSDTEGEGSEDVEQLEGSEQGDEAEEHAQAGDTSAKGGVLLNPVLLVVSKLLSMRYQVRLALLNAADYGVPQQRWRVLLFAALGSYELPAPPPRRYVPSASVLAAQRGRLKPCLPAKDTGFINRVTSSGSGDPYGDWVEVLCMPEPDPALCLPAYISLQEAWGDLPPLLQDANNKFLKRPPPETLMTNRRSQAAAAATEQQRGTQRKIKGQQEQQQQQVGTQQQRRQRNAFHLGTHVTPYDPAGGVMNCPVPVEGARPVSRYSRYMRSPHAPHQAVCMFNPNTLRDHTANYPPHEIRELLLVADCKAHADTEAEKAAWKDGKGRRPAADGVVASVLGHNEPKRYCLHFKEPRYMTLAERRRAQSLPDSVNIEGDFREKEQQVGNAVPYLLAAEIAASVWEAATGQQARRPPLLNGPCQEGVGIKDFLAQAHYSIWLQQQLTHAGWQGVVQASRKCLEQEANSMRAQQKQERLDLLREQHETRGNVVSTAPEPLQQQRRRQQQQSDGSGGSRKKPRSSRQQTGTSAAAASRG